MSRIHAFNSDDALGRDDALAVAERLRRQEVTPAEVFAAARARLHQVNPTLNALVVELDEDSAPAAIAGAVFSGVPSVIKDNTDVAGLPSRHGSRAVPEHPAAADGAFARQFLAQGMRLLGKSALPEFGFNASTEYAAAEPARNPWHTGHSPGGSSGGSAALVAAGVIPIAHANDGGGSIRIPAACCGLVGLKPSRGRMAKAELAKGLPINIIADGVVTRSVRDSAHFIAGTERYRPAAKLPKVGLVEGPGRERLRIGLVEHSISGAAIEAETLHALRETARLLEAAGHVVEPLPPPVAASFVDDFVDYWGFLAYAIDRFGPKLIHPDFDSSQLDGLSKGLATRFRSRWMRVPGVLWRLWRTQHEAAALTRRHELILSPVLAHPAPELGWLSPAQPYEQLMQRLLEYVAFTPINNTNGTPAISVPAGLSSAGLPLAVQISAGHGQERRLLEAAYLLEAERPFARIDAVTGAATGASD